MEYNACLPGTDSSGMVVHQIRTEQNPVQWQSKKREKEGKFALWTGGISWQSPSELAVQQLKYQKKGILYIPQQFLQEYNGWLVRKSFQLKECQYSRAAVGNFNTAVKTKTLQQVYKSLGWILMHLNSVPSGMPEQGHVCSSVKMDNTVFPSAPQAQQLDLMTATQFSRWTSLKKN